MPARVDGGGLVDGIQSLVPAIDDSDDLVGILGPTEWVRVGVSLFEEESDSGLEFDEGVGTPCFI